MTASTAKNKFEQVVHKFDPQSKLLRTWELICAPLYDWLLKLLYGIYTTPPKINARMTQIVYYAGIRKTIHLTGSPTLSPEKPP